MLHRFRALLQRQNVYIDMWKKMCFIDMHVALRCRNCFSALEEKLWFYLIKLVNLISLILALYRYNIIISFLMQK